MPLAADEKEGTSRLLPGQLISTRWARFGSLPRFSTRPGQK